MFTEPAEEGTVLHIAPDHRYSTVTLSFPDLTVRAHRRTVTLMFLGWATVVRRDGNRWWTTVSPLLLDGNQPVTVIEFARLMDVAESAVQIERYEP